MVTNSFLSKGQNKGDLDFILREKVAAKPKEYPGTLHRLP